jgi:hypothetical protein
MSRNIFKIIGGSLLLTLVGGGAWFLYVPKHWLTPFIGTVTVDERLVRADLYIGNPTDSEAEAIAFVHIPGIGDYLLSFDQEKYREASSNEFMRFKRGVWTFKPMNEGSFVSPLPFTGMNQFRLRSSNGHLVIVQF